MTICNELGLDMSQFEFTKPEQFYGVSTAGVLGWGVGAALGAKLAAPKRTVIGDVGDGSYMFGVPEAGHWVSRKMNLPVLYVVWNNSRWNAVQSATRGVYPDGWSVKTNNFPFSDLVAEPGLRDDLPGRRRLRRARRGPGAGAGGASSARCTPCKVEKRQALLNIIGA